MVLKVPSVHAVKKGDTLYGIARQAGVPLNELLDLNGLKASSLIKSGDRLYLPAALGRRRRPLPRRAPIPRSRTLPAGR